MTIYGSIEYRRIGIKKLLMLILPFIIFVCLVTPITNYIADGIVGAIFYWFVTDKRYVAFCRSTANEKNIIVD
ncbi:Amino acid permease-associated region precursor [Francisella sp. MA067296]|nr:Amino acid permease-associated region precursor [Francisella sp. MA067296]